MEVENWTIYEEGFDAYFKEKYQNPYPLTSQEHKDWQAGWEGAELQEEWDGN